MARRQFVRAASKRRVSWHGAAICVSNLVQATAQRVIVISETSMETFPNPTIVRVRGGLRVSIDDASAAGARGTVVMGLIVVTAAAQAASGVPLAFTDIGSDWLWWYSAPIETGPVADVNWVGASHYVDVDSKAMRKVGLNEILLFVTEITNCELALQANVHGALRVLLKAP